MSYQNPLSLLHLCGVYDVLGPQDVLVQHLKHDHDTDIGSVRPEGFPRHKRRRGEADTVDLDRTLQAVQRNLEGLTRQIPMVAMEDLPEAVQRRVVGVPRDWVRLFRRVATAITFYRNTTSGQGPED